MSEYRERLQLGSLSMRRVSHYMEYLARGGWDSISSAAREVRVEQRPRDIDVPVYTGRGVPDPWDVVEEPAPAQTRPSIRQTIEEPLAEPYSMTARRPQAADAFDAPDWGRQSPADDAWDVQDAYSPMEEEAPVVEQPEGILSDDELRRAMAFLSSDDEFLMTGVGVSAAQPAEPVSAYEPRSQGRSRSSGYVDALEISAEGADTRSEPRGGGLRVLIIVLAALFVLSAGGLAYVYFFTDWFTPAPAAVEAYEIFLGGESMGCVLDGQAVLNAIEQDRAQVQSDTGLPAQHALPVSAQPVRIEERFVADEEAMIQRIRQRSEVLVESAGVYLDGRLVGAVDSEQTVDSILEKALAPFLSLLEKRELTDVGFAQQVSTKPLLTSPEKLLDVDSLYALLMGETNASATYQVAQGDSLSAIAKRNDLSLAQLRYANPSLIGQDLIHPGMELSMQPPSGLLTVQFTERVTAEISMPYETETKQSSKLYTTQKQVERKGEEGLSQVVADRRYVAGVLVEETILEETVIKKPVTEVVVKGTKKPESGSSGNSKYMTPVNGRISSRFGSRWGSTHYGLDYAASTGTPIYASRGGTVTFAGNSASYGKYIKIDHGGGVETRYAHCSALKVSKGDKVKQGDLIALVGSTGRSTGPHLHFEIRVGGEKVNPLEEPLFRRY